MNINCCHISIVLALTNIITLAIFAGYTVKLRERQFLLEKKNGAEEAMLLKQLKALAELKSEIEKLKKDHDQ